MTADPEKPHLASYADLNHAADVELPQERFVALVREALPDCTSSDDEIDSVRDDVEWLFSKAHGRYNWAEFRTPRSILSARIQQLETSLDRANEILASSGHNRTKEDSDALSFISQAGVPPTDVTEVTREIVACHETISTLLARIKIAKEHLEQLNGAGNPPLLWYEPIVEASLLLARKLKVPLNTAGDRAGNPHETLFTRLTLSLEDFLPEEMRSNQLSGCAKRIERSATWALNSRDKQRN